MREMTDDEKSDQRWRDEMDQRYGWMSWGGNGFSFECGLGWKNILEDLFRRIDFALVDQDIRKEFQVTQIKEKFGTLRFYCHGGNEAVDAHIRVAEQMSEFTCERCGQRGTMHRKGWMSVRCEQCREEENKR